MTSTQTRLSGLPLPLPPSPSLPLSGCGVHKKRKREQQKTAQPQELGKFHHLGCDPKVSGVVTLCSSSPSPFSPLSLCLTSLPASLLSLIVSFGHLDEALLVLSQVSKVFLNLLHRSPNWCSVYFKGSLHHPHVFQNMFLSRFSQLRIPELWSSVAASSHVSELSELLASPVFRGVQKVALVVEKAGLKMSEVTARLESLQNLKMLEMIVRPTALGSVFKLQAATCFNSLCVTPPYFWSDAATSLPFLIPWIRERGKKKGEKKALYSLSLVVIEFNSEILDAISCLPLLQTLKMSAQKESSLDLLPTLGKLSTLKSLHLCNVDLSSSYTWSLVPQLEHLDLCEPLPADLAAWLKACPGLTTLCVEASQENQRGSLSFKNLAKLSSLTLNWIPPPLQIIQWDPIPPLTHLKIKGEEKEGSSTLLSQCLNRLGKVFPLLKSLDIECKDPDASRHFTFPELFVSLETFLWKGMGKTDALLGWISKLPKLRYLTLEVFERYGALTAKEVREVAEMKHLKHATLRGFPFCECLERAQIEEILKIRDNALHLQLDFSVCPSCKSCRPWMSQAWRIMQENSFP